MSYEFWILSFDRLGGTLNKETRAKSTYLGVKPSIVGGNSVALRKSYLSFKFWMFRNSQDDEEVVNCGYICFYYFFLLTSITKSFCLLASCFCYKLKTKVGSDEFGSIEWREELRAIGNLVAITQKFSSPSTLTTQNYWERVRRLVTIR